MGSQLNAVGAGVRIRLDFSTTTELLLNSVIQTMYYFCRCKTKLWWPVRVIFNTSAKRDRSVSILITLKVKDLVWDVFSWCLRSLIIKWTAFKPLYPSPQ